MRIRWHPGPGMLLLLLLLAVYSATACRTVGPGDAGELTTAMCTWGVAHAPGFPLLTLLGNLVSHVVHAREPAFTLNLLSALFSALACVVLARAVAILTGRPWAGFAAGLMLGTSRIFWEYALVVEVFGLNALLAALLLFLLARVLRGLEERRPALWALPVSALVMSACLTHHLTLALLALPVLVVLVLQVRPMLRNGVPAATIGKSVSWSVVAGFSGLLLLMYIPLAARLDPPLNWGDARDLGSLLHVLLRRDFGTGGLTSPNVLVSKLLETGESASPFGFRHSELFLRDLPHSFGWLFLVLPAFGLAWAFQRRRPLLWLSLLFAATTALFFTRVNAPIVPLYLGITRPFYILPHVFLAFLAGLGIAGLMEGATKLHRLAPAAVGAIAIAGAGFMVVAQLPSVETTRTNVFTREFGANLISGLPARAILLSDGDLFRNSFYYQQDALGRRPDVALVEQPMLSAAWYVRQLRRRHALALPESMEKYDGTPATESRVWLDLNLRSAIESNGRPVAAVRLIDDSYRSAYRLLTTGMWSEVAPRSTPVDVSAWAQRSMSAVRGWDITSIARTYPETSWEASDGVFYPYALGRLRALIEVALPSRQTASAIASVPALGQAEQWRGPRRAEYLAYQADFWQTCIAESLLSSRSQPESLLAARSMALAESSLAIDPSNLQALQAVAALRSTVALYRDPLEELRVRKRIVDLRPGDLAELVPYFRLVMSDPALQSPSTLEQAEEVRSRFVRILELCMKCSDNPDLVRLHEYWSASLDALISRR